MITSNIHVHNHAHIQTIIFQPRVCVIHLADASFIPPINAKPINNVHRWPFPMCKKSFIR